MARYNKPIVLLRLAITKPQKTVSLSTAEAEFYAASEMAISEVMVYLRNLLENMGF